MKIYKRIIGNTSEPEWKAKLEGFDTEYLELDQWTAQKSRFTAVGSDGETYALSLPRNTHLSNGDLIDYMPLNNKALVIRLSLNDVLAIDLSAIMNLTVDRIIDTAFEIGHATGNQHWPAVVKGTTIYVPLTVDRKVMSSVMETHNFEGITCRFVKADDVIPFLEPHQIRRLTGATDHLTQHSLDHDRMPRHDHKQHKEHAHK